VALTQRRRQREAERLFRPEAGSHGRARAVARLVVVLGVRVRSWDCVGITPETMVDEDELVEKGRPR
jgi:hypothetical protein